MAIVDAPFGDYATTISIRQWSLGPHSSALFSAVT